MILLNGRETADQYYESLSERFVKEQQKPTLAVILVGKNPASAVYVSNKEKACAKAGINSIAIKLSTEVSEAEVLEKIKELNKNPEITGIIVQVPLPKHISPEKVLMAIDPRKDADGFHPDNLGKMYLHQEILPPATPKGIIMLLDRYNIDLEGKHVVVVGRSNNVGKAVALMCLNRNATLTVCHSKTKNLKEITKQADVLIAAVGQARFITADMVKENAVVVDVGIHRMESGNLCGDVDFENVSKKTSAISPVPGGVGPMTVAALLANTIGIYDASSSKF